MFQLSYRFAAVAAILLGAAGAAPAQVFNQGLPASWQCQGSCGTAAADGDIALAPGGGQRYGWVSTAGGDDDVLLPGVSIPANSANGSLLHTHVFDAHAGQALTFSFNFITTDSGDFSDYAWIRMLNEDGSQAAMLVTARVEPAGGFVPGFGMDPAQATTTPHFVYVSGGAPAWSPLGASSGTCYVEPCGQTGWITAVYPVAATGRYYLEFGAVNWVYPSNDTGLAFDRLALDGTPLLPVPEPATITLLLAGAAVLARQLRRHCA